MGENKFNVCSRCGSANPISARYCYQCGFEMKSPEAPVVCPKCNTVNQSSANFCKRCGSPLPKPQNKIICPTCGCVCSPEAKRCLNCGQDFSAVVLPSSLQIQQAMTEVAVTKTGGQKLSRKEKRKLKREEEERAYREAIEEKKRKKLEKQQLKAAKKREKNQPQAIAQPVYPPQPMPADAYAYNRYSSVQPMAAVAQTYEEKPKTKRFKNIVVLLIALLGLYFILLPQQIDFFKLNWTLATVTVGESQVALGGWDLIVAALSNFSASLIGLSPTVEAVGQIKSFEVIISGLVLAVVAIELAVCVLAKLVRIIAGRYHEGLDWKSIIAFVVTGGLLAYLVFSKPFAVMWSYYSFVIPAVFLLVAVFNSNRN